MVWAPVARERARPRGVARGRAGRAVPAPGARGEGRGGARRRGGRAAVSRSPPPTAALAVDPGAAASPGRRPRDPAPVGALAPTPAQSPRGAAAREEVTTNTAPRHRRPRRHLNGRPWPGAAAVCAVRSERQRRPPARSAPASLQARHDPGLALSGCFLSPFAGGYLWGTIVATPTPILQSNRCLFLWRRGRTRLFIFNFPNKLLPGICPAKQLRNRFKGASPG